MQPLKHLAIIMDGNGRWAAKRNLPKIEGHRRGTEAARAMIQHAMEHGIEYLTLYALSTENYYKRPRSEIDDILSLLEFYINKELQELHRHDICVRIVGDITPLSTQLQRSIKNAIELTKNNKRLTLCIAMGYSGREEIVNACKAIIQSNISTEDVTEQIFAQHLYDPSMPEVDLLIRTSGEQRISNFLLWHSAYAELYFTETLWPDFTTTDLTHAIDNFNKRNRNFGMTRLYD